MELHQNIKRALISLFFIIILVAIDGCTKDSPPITLSKTTFDKDTTWQGTIICSGDIYIPPGITLTILPGTTVKFKRIDETSSQNLFIPDSPYYPQAELIVRGRLVAKGNEKKPIVFTSAEIDARPGDWGAINLLGSKGNTVEFAKILFAYNGIHAHGSVATITDSEFANNGVGISFKSEEETPDAPWFGERSRLTITNNVFFRNKGGIGFRNSDASISHNEIKENKFFGLWPKEKVKAEISYNEITDNKKGIILYQTQGLTLENNNIYNNKSYNIAVAEAQDFPIEARNNWFGSINSEKIAEYIFDQKDDSELGLVNTTPYLKKAVEWEQP